MDFKGLLVHISQIIPYNGCFVDIFLRHLESLFGPQRYILRQFKPTLDLIKFNTLQESLLFFRQTISVNRPFEGGHSWPEVSTVCFDRTSQHS